MHFPYMPYHNIICINLTHLIITCIALSYVVLIDLSGCGIGYVCRNSWRICGRCTCDVIGAAESVVGRGGGQGEVAIDSVATVGLDGGCVGIELDLQHLKSLEGVVRVCRSHLGEYRAGKKCHYGCVCCCHLVLVLIIQGSYFDECLKSRLNDELA
jgi:hypothetical protein